MRASFAAHYWDYSRDLLHMVNEFRGDMTRPIVGLGHSMGGAYLYVSLNNGPCLGPRPSTSPVAHKHGMAC